MQVSRQHKEHLATHWIHFASIFLTVGILCLSEGAQLRPGSLSLELVRGHRQDIQDSIVDGELAVEGQDAFLILFLRVKCPRSILHGKNSN